MIYPVAALYVDPRGPYPDLAAECFDEFRDATTYAGQLPVVAYPPCGPWSRLKAFSRNHRHDLAIIAVQQVRTWRGVLEHPADSTLWKALQLPRPGELFADEFGGRSYAVYQGDYGHSAPKLTWFYAVGLPPPSFGIGQGGQRGRIALMPKNQRHITPAPMAELLCQWAVS